MRVSWWRQLLWKGQSRKVCLSLVWEIVHRQFNLLLVFDFSYHPYWTRSDHNSVQSLPLVSGLSPRPKGRWHSYQISIHTVHFQTCKDLFESNRVGKVVPSIRRKQVRDSAKVISSSVLLWNITQQVSFNRQYTILQLSARWPGLWMAARLKVTLFSYTSLLLLCKSSCFNAN